jgi:hypothetical protein
MANYGITNSTNIVAQPAGTATYTAQIWVAAANAILNAPTITGLRRGKIYDLLVGTNGTASDNSSEWTIQRVSANSSIAIAGSISSISSQFALDQADAAFAALAAVNSTGASSAQFPALQQQVWYTGINTRASYRWVAAPGSELVYPAVSSATGGNGLALSARSVQGYTGTFTATMLFQEQ